ncbi:MAG: carbon storage regulator [Thermoguttaceae bacterium]|nr:carbon storage regulator [Thermoguttaceae bacterium]
MLVLSRYEGQTIQIGDHITITVVRVNGSKVRIGIETTDKLPILRGELLNHDSTATVVEFPTSQALQTAQLQVG